MAKKAIVRKPGGAAGIPTIEDEIDHGTEDAGHVSNGSQSEMAASGAKPKRTGKTKADQQSNEQFGVGDIRKAAAFVNAVGGLDKAIAILQILKVAKEVQ